MWTKTDESTYRLNKERNAVSMENMDEEGRKDALTGDEETSWRGGGKEEQRISVLGNSKFNIVTWCRSFNGLQRIKFFDSTS